MFTNLSFLDTKVTWQDIELIRLSYMWWKYATFYLLPWLLAFSWNIINPIEMEQKLLIRSSCKRNIQLVCPSTKLGYKATFSQENIHKKLTKMNICFVFWGTTTETSHIYRFIFLTGRSHGLCYIYHVPNWASCLKFCEEAVCNRHTLILAYYQFGRARMCYSIL